MLEFGIFDHLDRRDEPLAQTYARRLELVRAAEAAGFRGYHLAEHHGTPLGMAPSPGVFLAAVAQATSRIRLGPMVYLLPLYIPLRLIEEICMLDHLSGGRLDVGTGRGASPAEVGFFGVPGEASAEIYAEALEVIVKGLSAERLSHHGRYFHYDDVPMVMRPLQRPVPLWTGSMSPDGQVHAARRGMHFVGLGRTAQIAQAAAHYRQAWEASREDPLRPPGGPATPYVGAYRMVVAAATDAAAERLARPAYLDWFEKFAKLWRERGLTSTFLGPLSSFEAARAAGSLVCGTPARVADALAAQAEACALNYFMVQLSFGNLPHDAELRSLERFAAEVMPALAHS
jgi:alkanesulfonate monooxygenase SsuD/methylene tetrahydromethanopterin reductase-like flavin-dependent oxidoreductase (luciferase family)